MAYTATLDHFLETLHARVPAKVDALRREKRRVVHGLLSVGLKLHCLGEDHHFSALFTALGGEFWPLDRNVYKHARAKFCLVLPPVGSARAAVSLLECIEEYTGCRLFNNPNVQLQVCSPGRLSPRNAALNAIGFYLSSDTLRQYELEDFATTVSNDLHYDRGKRLVIYDAGPSGEFDPDFAWWARHGAGGLTVRSTLPFLNARTDLLLGPGSRIDIQNVNLLATLLVHAQSERDGYWSSLGELFADELTALLDRHLLAGLLDAPWVCAAKADRAPWTCPPIGSWSAAHDRQFISALQELTAYAAAEAGRLSGMTAARGGILSEVQTLLANYRTVIASETEQGGCSAHRSPTGLGTD